MSLLLDDGKIRLEVVNCHSDAIETRAAVGGELSDRKGVNVPEAVLQLSPLTDKDRRDLAFGLELGVDWVALSFVQRPEDIDEARGLIGDKAFLMAKIEKPSAVRHRGDRRARRRDHGGARRPRRRGAGGERAGHPETHRPGLPPARQAGGGGHPDASSRCASPRPDPRRGDRRSHRGGRRRRRGDALGGNRFRTIPSRGGRDDGEDRPPGGGRAGLPRPARGQPSAARRYRLRCDQLRDPPGQPDPPGGGAGELHRVGQLDPARRPRAAQGADPQPDPEPAHRAATDRSLGRVFGGQRATGARRRDLLDRPRHRPGPAHGAPRRHRGGHRRRAVRSPALARPTCCASRPWRRRWEISEATSSVRLAPSPGMRVGPPCLSDGWGRKYGAASPSIRERPSCRTMASLAHSHAGHGHSRPPVQLLPEVFFFWNALHA